MTAVTIFNRQLCDFLSSIVLSKEDKKGSSVKCVDMRPEGHKLIAHGIALGGHWVLHTP